MNVPTFLIPTTKRVISQSDVIRFEGCNRYTLIYVRGENKPIVYSRWLSLMCQRYPFMVRVSRNLAVNPAHVERTQSWNIIQIGSLSVKLIGRYAAVLRSNRLPLANKHL